MSTKKWKNPFYVLLIPVGAAFCITGFAYGLLAFEEVNTGAMIRSTDDSSAEGIQPEHPLHSWLRAHGSTAILAELAILAVLTFGAIATDSWWTDEQSSTLEQRSTKREE